ncbi:ATP-binding protein, partial [Streptomyces platensis]|nr:ATP-binding protein [Streptomyces platensis]
MPPARTGTRRNRQSTHQVPVNGALQRRMILLPVLPALLIAVAAALAITFVLLSQEGSPDAVACGILIGAAVFGCGVLLIAAVVGDAEARSLARRFTVLRRTSTRGQADLQELLHRISQGERIDPPQADPLPEPAGDAIDLLAHELAVAQRQAEAAVMQAAQLARGNRSGSEDKVEVFANLSRRLQSLVHRSIQLLDELENNVEDPDLLKGLFQVDHLATRIRRHAENLAVLGGAVSRRQWTRPVTMTEVLRSAIAEVERYSRVKLAPPIEGRLHGHAVADVIHLLAELIENATVFSSPQTQVILRAQRVTAGLAVEVEDRGLGIPREEQIRMNALLADPEHIDVGELLKDGRIGLFVVSTLARRHGIEVQLQSNIYGGTQAVLVVPESLLGDEPEPSRPETAAPTPVEAPVPQHPRAVEPEPAPVRAMSPAVGTADAAGATGVSKPLPAATPQAPSPTA